jgi:hypothetical protein
MGFAPVALLGLVRPLDGRLSETWITSGALCAPLGPTGLRREYTKGLDRHPFEPDALAPLVSGAAHC